MTIIENIKSSLENIFKKQISNFDIGTRPRVESNHKDRYNFNTKRKQKAHHDIGTYEA